MRFLTLNVRGLGGLAKKKSLRILISSLSPDVILLQETMTSIYPALFAFSKLCPGWEFCAIKAKGLSGGILSGWNPKLLNCKAFHTAAGILLKASLRSSPLELSILNCYGPYINRDSFWNSATTGGLLSLPNLILAGDLNFTLNASEIWGSKLQLDPLGPFFSELFSDHHLVDVAPTGVGPTWRNGRMGEEGISKRLDRFLLSDQLVNSLPRFRVWTHRCGISDHFPVILDWQDHRTDCAFPFKFNQSWLSNEEFKKMIRAEWPLILSDNPMDPMYDLSYKL